MVVSNFFKWNFHAGVITIFELGIQDISAEILSLLSKLIITVLLGFHKYSTDADKNMARCCTVYKTKNFKNGVEQEIFAGFQIMVSL